MFAKEHEDEENMFDICIKVEDFYCVIQCMDIVTSVVTVSKPKTAVFGSRGFGFNQNFNV